MAVILAGIACSELTGPSPGLPQRRLAVSEQSACALDAGGAVYCWGRNGVFWEFGVSTFATTGSDLPIAVPAPRLVSLGSGIGTHSCGINAAREAVCWGRNQFGELGNGEEGTQGNPASVVRGSVRWADIAIGRITTCGRSDTGTGFCWGVNQRGEIGNESVPVGEGSVASTPVAVNGGMAFTQIVAGWLHACGIAVSGIAYCWGSNDDGQLGVGSADEENHPTPEEVTGGRRWLYLSLGSRYTCGIASDSTAHCWGFNATGQLGDGTVSSRSAPTPIASDLKFLQLATSSGFATASTVAAPVQRQGGVGHSCALTVTGRPYCWGWNGDGQLGDGTTITRLTPVPVEGNLAVQVISTGSASTCGMRSNAIWCWGSNLRGQLGGSPLERSSVPVPVGPPFNAP